MKLTTQSILTQLPISPELRDKLLQKLEMADADTKFHMEQQIWDAHFELETHKEHDAIKIKMEKVKNKEEPIGDDFYTDAIKSMEEDTKKASMQANDTTEIENVRSKLQELMN